MSDIQHTQECIEATRLAESLRTAWLSKWPNYCRTCNGWGGKSFWHTPGDAAHGQEQLFEPCSDCSAAETPICGRCMEPLTEDAKGGLEPCKSCGWDTNDGLPEEPECYCWEASIPDYERDAARFAFMDVDE